VVTTHFPVTVVPGRSGNAEPFASVRPLNDRSPTLIIRERRLSLVKKSSILK
jgi:hypothetical protein